MLCRPGTGEPCVVEFVFERATELVRCAAGPTVAPQVLAANVDLAIVVTALSPDDASERAVEHGVNVRRIERCLEVAARAGIPAVVGGVGRLTVAWLLRQDENQIVQGLPCARLFLGFSGKQARA